MRPFWESAPLLRERTPFERASPFWNGMFNFDQWVRKGAPVLEGHAPFGRACSTLSMGEEGRAPFGRARTFWKGAYLLEGHVQL